MRARPASLCLLRLAAAFLLAATLLPCAALAAGQNDADTPWQIGVKTKVLLNSHTSYEFGNPGPPYQMPLSRLEFPMDSTWLGIEARRRFGRASLGLQYMNSVADQNGGTFHDSDWDDDNEPTRLTNLGIAKSILRPSYELGFDLDLELADVAGLPAGFELKPVGGYRWQRLNFTINDGYQQDWPTAGAAPNVHILSGDLITFQQDWHRLFYGLRLGYDWATPPLLRHVKLTTQADLAYVLGHNVDRHLLRRDRKTTENTRGHAAHANAALTLGLLENLDLGIELDYLRIETFGSHKLTQESFNYAWASHVKVWSEQTSLMFKLDYRF